MTSGTVSSLFVLLLSCSPALAQQQAQFNQVLNINGDVSDSVLLSSTQVTVLTTSDDPQLLPIPGWIQGGDVLSEATTINC